MCLVSELIELPTTNVSLNSGVFSHKSSRLTYSGWDGSSWNGFEDLEGIFSSNLDVTAWSANRLDFFGLGTNSVSYHAWFNGTVVIHPLPVTTSLLIDMIQWNGYFESQGGIFTSPITSISYAPDTLQLFGLGTDSAAYYKNYNNIAGWSGWTSLGGIWTSKVVASTWGDNEIDIFARGYDNAIHWNHWNGLGWSGWQSLGGKSCISVSLSAKTHCLIGIVLLTTVMQVSSLPSQVQLVGDQEE
jgi:hypothetical protein